MKESENMDDYSGFCLSYGWDVGKKIPLDVECYKWLSYESEKKKERVALINSKNADEITRKDVAFLEEQKHLTYIKKILRDYLLTGNFNKKTWKIISMCKENDDFLKTIMIDKLTKQELLEAKEKLLNYKSETLEKLSKIVRNFENNYDTLSYIDAYVFHYLSEYYYYYDYRAHWQALNDENYRKALISEKMREDSAIAAKFRL